MEPASPPARTKALALPPDDNGSYVVRLTVVDDDHGGTGTASSSAVVNNRAPTLTIYSPAYGILYALDTTVGPIALASDARRPKHRPALLTGIREGLKLVGSVPRHTPQGLS